MAFDQQGESGGTGGAGGFGGPPPPPRPPQPPTAPPSPPPPADWLRAVAVGLLNLSGLGFGYALVRRWPAAAACWIATGILLLVALPADPDGVSGGAVVAYLVFLGLAALHGAARGLRTRLVWPPRAPLAVLLGLVLLGAPVGGAVLYDDARDEAVQKMLLKRLDAADLLVRNARTEPFETAEPEYRKALSAYRDLWDHHPGSRAARRVPARLKTYYATIGAPYDQKRFCDAVAPLKYLRTVPETYGRKNLGSLAAWPDDRLATSFLECGVDEFTADGSSVTNSGNLGELLTTFPRSPQAAKVEPAVRSTIDNAGKDVKGGTPCAAASRLRTLGSRAWALAGESTGVAAALNGDARRADSYVQAGTYACGVDEYRNGDFDNALSTMNDFVDTYPHDRNRALAKKIAIAAEIAKETPDAGKRLPTLASGGGIPVTVSNDSPDDVEVLYTGPVTGSFTLKGCGSCATYSSQATASYSACKESGTNYPKKTINLPAGTTYFLHTSLGGSTATPGTDTVKLRYGYIYTECAYVVESAYGF
ncbi:hypothetical protein [Streptomyces sp.]|uniref:hypothetical protein n=1 Tax=Streptomyces sp. TaxID=1931 RepID=UPI002F3EA6E7